MSSIKNYIFTRFLGVILIQVILVGIFAWINFKKTLQHSLNENFDVLISVSQNIEYFYKHQIDEFDRITTGKGFVPYNRLKAQEVIEDFINVRGLISTVHFYNTSGNLEFVAKAKHIQNYQPEKNYKNHRDKQFINAFERVLQNQKKLITPPLYTRSGIFYHVCLLPVFANNKLKGILSFAFVPAMNPVDRSFKGLSLNKENFLVLTDQDGNIISTNNISADAIKASIKTYISKRGKTPENPFDYQHRDINELKYKIKNAEYYLLSQQIKNIPIFAVLGVNEKILSRPSRRLFDFVISIAAISSLIGALAAIFISKKISKGLEIVLSSIQDLRLGYFKKRKIDKLHPDFKKALNEIEDLSIQIEKGKYLGSFWGQEKIDHDHKNN